ncbi:uncharacterized protein [Apostichopus japonicus]|uniref:uncharacterized protein isoform X2 n=1 Tax=Stichopus japonicus TaxID=307972 RepID=UPI003AB12134
MFFTFSLASYYASSYMARKFTKFLAYGRAQYILPEGCYGYRPPFQDLQRKPFNREFPVTEENISSLLCFPSEQTMRMREDLLNSYLDLTLQDQLKLYPDFGLANLEECLLRGLSSSIPLDHKNDPARIYFIPNSCDFGIISLPRIEQYTTPAAFVMHQQDDTTSTWSDIQGQHTQQTTTTRCEGYTLTYYQYTFKSSTGPDQMQNTEETLTDPTGNKTATKYMYYWTDGVSLYQLKANKITTQTEDGQTITHTQDIQQCDYSVFGIGKEELSHITDNTVVAGKQTTINKQFSLQTSVSDGTSYQTQTQSGSEETVSDDDVTTTVYQDQRISTDGVSSTVVTSSSQLTRTDDTYYSHSVSETTTNDGSYEYQAEEIDLRQSDGYIFIKQTYPAGKVDDVYTNDDRHLYLQC